MATVTRIPISVTLETFEKYDESEGPKSTTFSRITTSQTVRRTRNPKVQNGEQGFPEAPPPPAPEHSKKRKPHVSNGKP